MKISESLSRIRNVNPLLYFAGLVHLGLFIVFIPLFFWDDRIITGINAWIKPMKFALSIFIYLWTFAWLLQYVQHPKKVIFISWGILICMVVEMALITLQAARGVPSHFNITSALNATIFSTMGIFIGINSLLVLYTIFLFFSHAIVIPDKIMLFAWRAGLILFFIGGISGGMMSTHLAHTYGAPDGGPGIPFLNWSTIAGDLRIGHFVTLHGLQFIPLIALLIKERVKNPVVLVQSAFAFYVVICIALHLIALSGKALIG